MIYAASWLIMLVALSCGPSADDLNSQRLQPPMEAPLKIVARNPCRFSGQRLLLTGRVREIRSEHTFTLEDGEKMLVRTVEPISEQLGPLEKGERISVSGILVTTESEKPMLVVGRTDIFNRFPCARVCS